MSRPRKPGGRLAWMAFYVDDFLSATAHLTAGEVGSYMLLIVWYWRTGGPIPDEDDQLRRVARCSRSEWKRTRPMLERFFSVEGGRWSHKRIDHELEVAKAISMAASESGKLGNKSKWKLRDPEELAIAEMSRRDRERDPEAIADGSLLTPFPSPSAIAPGEDGAKPRVRRKAIDPATEELPGELDDPELRRAIGEYFAYRVEQGWKPWGASTWRENVARWAAWGSARTIAAIRSSIANTWRGVYEEKGGRSSSGVPSSIRPQPTIDPLADARHRLRSLVEAVAEGAEVPVDADVLKSADQCASAAAVEALSKSWIAANRPTIDASGVWR